MFFIIQDQTNDWDGVLITIVGTTNTEQGARDYLKAIQESDLFSKTARYTIAQAIN